MRTPVVLWTKALIPQQKTYPELSPGNGRAASYPYRSFWPPTSELKS